MKKYYLRFWKFMAYIIVICLAASFVPKIGLAQQNQSLFIVVDLMKVKPGDGGKYVHLEQQIFKPYHQERINKGIIVGWFLYRVMYAGADDKYNYATVNVYADPAKLETPYEGIDFEKIHPGKDFNEVMNTTLNVRTIVQEQLMSRVNYAYPEGGGGLGSHKYLVVNYMKTIPGGNFLQIENELAKPTAEELVKNGDWAGWTLWSNVFPNGTGMASDFVTADYYPDFINISTANYMEAFQKAHPNKEWSELVEKAGNSRNIVRKELWRLLDAVVAE